MPIEAVSLPFAEQAAFFRRKLNIPTEAWTDLYGAEHDYGFMVAGANRDDLLADFRAAAEKVVAEGGTLQEFRRDFDRIVEQYGWSYNGGRNWRSRVIYETNLNTSYMAGRFEQLMELREVRPYWQYLHSNAVEDPRPEHLAWHGMILRWDDPWWQAHFPTNGWGCQCRVIALSDADLERMGRTVDTAPEIEYEERLIGQRSPGGPRLVRVPRGIDPGFEYTPGRSRLEGFVPPGGGTGNAQALGAPGVRLGTPADALPASRELPLNRLLDAGIEPESAIDLFLDEFGASAGPAIYQDLAGEHLAIGRNLFYRPSGELKLRGSRAQYALLMADTIRQPDEIWVAQEWHDELQKTVTRRRYIAQWQLEDQAEPVLAVFELGRDAWEGITAFAPDARNYLQRRVRGVAEAVRVYRRGDDAQ